MNALDRDVAGVDLLARTTLRIDEATQQDRVTELLAALRRVPGVLLADIHSARDRAIVVAHDAGVSGAAILAAAERTGVRSTIVREHVEPLALTGTVSKHTHAVLQWLLRIWTAAILLLAVFAAIVPGTKPWFLPVYACTIAVAFALQILSTRRIS
jgi:hypothetical protein